MAKPKIEIQDTASKFLEGDAVKRLSKKRAEQGYLAKEYDLPPWKRSSQSSKEPTPESESQPKDQNSDPDLSEVFNTIFSKDYASTLLAMGAIGGFAFAVVAFIFFNEAGNQVDRIVVQRMGGEGLGYVALLLILVVWSILLIILCRMHHKRQLRRVTSAMASEMVRMESELEASHSPGRSTSPSPGSSDSSAKKRPHVMSQSDSEWH